MNKLITASLIAALSGLFGAPQTASARNNEVAAAIGGFIGGVIVGSAVSRDHGRHEPRVHGHVVVQSRYGHRQGYWEWTTVRVWVPGHWVMSRDHRGRQYRHYVRGHYEHRRERVWVSNRRYRR